MKCPKCGSNKFYAIQRVEKYDTVIVDENGSYIDEGDGQFHHPEEDSCVDYSKPEGPFYCVVCHTEAEEDDE